MARGACRPAPCTGSGIGDIRYDRTQIPPSGGGPLRALPDFDAQTLRALSDCGINSLEDVRRHRRHRLITMSGLSRADMAVLDAALAGAGIAFRR